MTKIALVAFKAIIAIFDPICKSTLAGSANGGVTVPNGGIIAFTSNSFIKTENNTAYTCTVSERLFYNPDASNFKVIMPGALKGFNDSYEESGCNRLG